MPIQLTAYVTRLIISPVGARALFIVAYEPSPTPNQNSLPGTSRFISPGELWYWENGIAVKLRPIEGCEYRFTWSHDENIVIIKAGTRGLCTEAFAWIVDLEKLELQILFPRDWNYANAGTFSFSPDIARFLYSNLGSLQVYDISTSEDTNIGESFDLYFIFNYWLYDQTLLVSYQDEKFDPKPRRFGILNLTTMELHEFINPREILAFRGREIVAEKLSPDKQWLVFGVGSSSNDIQEIWIVKLEDILP